MEKISTLFREVAQAQIKKNLEGVSCLFVVKYAGLSAPAMTILRHSLLTSGAKLFIVKNTVSRRVFESSGYESITQILQGACGVVFGKGDPIGISKALYNFTKENENLKIEGGLLQNRVLSRSEIVVLANLPSKHLLYAKLAGTLNAPINRMVWVLSGLLKKLVNILDQIKEKKVKH